MAVTAKKQEHVFLTELESAQEVGLNYKVDATTVLLDLKVLMSEYYAATFTETEYALQLQFNNGQKFILSAKEVL